MLVNKRQRVVFIEEHLKVEYLQTLREQGISVIDF